MSDAPSNMAIGASLFTFACLMALSVTIAVTKEPSAAPIGWQLTTHAESVDGSTTKRNDSSALGFKTREECKRVGAEMVAVVQRVTELYPAQASVRPLEFSCTEIQEAK